LRERVKGIARFHLVSTLGHARLGVSGRGPERDHEPQRREPEHGALAERAGSHDSNSAYRMPNSPNRPEGGSQRTFTVSTRDRGGPWPSSRINASINGRGPSARARTRPSLRFMTKPASPRLEPRRCALCLYPTRWTRLSLWPP